MGSRESAAGSLVLVRHGRTRWNEEGRIIGWEDPPLSEAGRRDAAAAASVVRGAGLRFPMVCTSAALRCSETAAVVLEALGAAPGRVVVDWRLNERHFGLLQGLDRGAVRQAYGREQVRAWKHDLDAVPPEVPPDDPRHPRHDARFRGVRADLLPGAESLAAVAKRVDRCWAERLVPALAAGLDVVVVGHCHSLRVLAQIAAVAAAGDLDTAAQGVPAGMLAANKEAAVGATAPGHAGGLPAPAGELFGSPGSVVVVDRVARWWAGPAPVLADEPARQPAPTVAGPGRAGARSAG